MRANQWRRRGDPSVPLQARDRLARERGNGNAALLHASLPLQLRPPPAMIASGKSARIVNGGNGVGSAQSAKRLRVGHRGHHGTRLKAGNASQRRKTSPVRQQRSLRLSQNSLFCDVAEVSNTSAALIGIFATCSWSPESYKDREGKEAQANAYRHRSRRNEVHDEAGASRAHNAACRVG